MKERIVQCFTFLLLVPHQHTRQFQVLERGPVWSGKLVSNKYFVGFYNWIQFCSASLQLDLEQHSLFFFLSIFTFLDGLQLNRLKSLTGILWNKAICLRQKKDLNSQDACCNLCSDKCVFFPTRIHGHS